MGNFRISDSIPLLVVIRVQVPGTCPVYMFQPEYEKYLLKSGILDAVPVPLEAKHLKFGMEELKEMVGINSIVLGLAKRPRAFLFIFTWTEKKREGNKGNQDIMRKAPKPKKNRSLGIKF